MTNIPAAIRKIRLPDLPTLIIIAALFVSAPRLAAALSFVEPQFLGLPIELLTGPAFGLSTAGATVYVWDIYRGTRKGAKMRNWLMIGWAALLVLIAAILVPGMVVELRKSELAELVKPPWDWLWCSILALSAEGVVGLVALARSIAMPKAKPEKTQASTELAQAKHKRFACDLCGAQASLSGRPFRTPQAIAAHKRWCKASAPHPRSK